MGENLTPQIPIETVLETARCQLRYPSPADVQDIFAALRSPSFPRQLPLGQVRSLDEVANWVRRCRSAWSRGSAFTWSVTRRFDPVLLGQVTLASRPDPGAWALAFWIHPVYWGEGYATESARRVLEFAFTDLTASLIWAGAATWNSPSIRVLEKLGMVYVSEDPQGYFIDQEPIPTCVFELSREKWLTDERLDHLTFG